MYIGYMPRRYFNAYPSTFEMLEQRPGIVEGQVQQRDFPTHLFQPEALLLFHVPLLE